MSTLAEIDDPIVKTKILKSLLSTIVNDGDVIALIEEYIEKLEEESLAEESPVDDTPEEGTDEDNFSMGGSGSSDFGGGLQDDLLGDMSGEDEFSDEESGLEEPSSDDGETILPSPADLELDLTDNNSEI
jgi:hypothetical protein